MPKREINTLEGLRFHLDQDHHWPQTPDTTRRQMISNRRGDHDAAVEQDVTLSHTHGEWKGGAA